MFRGINLCGAEVNTKFSEQHRTHLLHSYIRFIVTSFLFVVKSVIIGAALTLKVVFILPRQMEFYFLY